MRVATTGSRHWKDYLSVYRELRKLQTFHGSDLIVCGGISAGGGADAHVKTACESLGIKFEPYSVLYGGVDGPNPKMAPLNRNIRMLNHFKPDLLVAWRATGKSNGTDHTIKNAEILGVPVRIINEG